MQPDSGKCVYLPGMTVFRQPGLRFPISDPRLGSRENKATTNFPIGWDYQWSLEIRNDTPNYLLVKRSTYSDDSPRAVLDVRFPNQPPLLIECPIGQKQLLKKSISQNNFRVLLAQNNITADVTLIIPRETDSDVSSTDQIRHLRFEDHFKKLFESQMGSDVTIITDNGRLSAHWAVLAARCPFFCGMLNNNCKEKRDNTIELNINYEAGKKMLEYIYTDKVDIDVVQDGQALLAIGDVYLMDGLKNAAETFLCNRVAPSNALDLLVLSHQHNVRELKITALDILSSWPSFATESENFSEFCARHPDLVTDLLNHKAEKVYKLDRNNVDLGRALYVGLGKSFFWWMTVTYVIILTSRTRWFK